MSRVTDLASELEGSCMNYPDTDSWSNAELEELDNLVFECVICGWWFSTDDEWDEQMCCDCAQEEDIK